MTTDIIAVWDWERDPLPNARVVVCRPGILTHRQGQTFASKGALFGIKAIVPERDWFGWTALCPTGLTPALYAERQSDLARLPGLLAVKAERRALVLCPREAITIKFCRLCQNNMAAVCSLHQYSARVDLVVIIPPPEARTCDLCKGTGEIFGDFGRGDEATHCDAGCIRGRIQPWPMHPDWIRGIVEQCRAAGVPVCFLGWGAWLPYDQIDYQIEQHGGPHPETRTDFDQRQTWYRVGADRSGRLLDGAEIMEVPEWLSGQEAS